MREIGSLQIQTGYLTVSLKKTELDYKFQLPNCEAARAVVLKVFFLISLLQTQTLSIPPQQISQKGNCKNFTLPIYAVKYYLHA